MASPQTDRFIVNCQNIYYYLHAKRMSKRLGGKWPAKIKNWANIYNKPEWPHVQRIQRLIQESNNEINYKDLIDAAFEFNKDGWVVANNLYSPQYIKIYKEYMKKKEDDNDPEKIKEGIIRSTKFVIRICKANKFETLEQYLLAEDEFVPLVIDHYQKGLITKPFFYILDFLHNLIGNMGWAILIFAALLRLVMLPVANASYASMSKMKKIQPKVMAIQQLYKNDKIRLQQETMELYRKEKINPAAGCLPMFIQIPVFFSLYKVLNIAIEIRHAPVIGWIKDLSAPDPLTISVWSHIPLPSLLDIGIWPICMGLTMWFQQKLNPAPANKDQARMFALMPFIFTLMLGHFASGLVIYWTLSNLLSIIQQKVIMKKYGVK